MLIKKNQLSTFKFSNFFVFRNFNFFDPLNLMFELNVQNIEQDDISNT